MKKVNLDEEFEIWKNENEERIKEKFLEIHDFDNCIEEEWRRYQDENGLIDESNEEDLKDNSKDSNEYPYGEEKDEESEGIHLKNP